MLIIIPHYTCIGRLLRIGSLGVTMTEGKCGGVLRAVPVKHPHITTPPWQIPENLIYVILKEA
jgi:hypothetical protein